MTSLSLSFLLCKNEDVSVYLLGLCEGQVSLCL